jgi:hypothetical protein
MKIAVAGLTKDFIVHVKYQIIPTGYACFLHLLNVWI